MFRPKMVRDVMNEFTNEIIGGSDYIALHWRYDKNDWYLHCEKLAKNSTKFRFHPDKDFDKCKGVAEVPIGTLMGRFDAFLTNMTTVSFLVKWGAYYRLPGKRTPLYFESEINNQF